ncbi:MAG: type II toxin-antitoxin system Phd/YefM family antitoxin [Thermoanaerobaculia bacterium]
MKVINATTARTTFFRLMDDVAESHEPILVTGRRHAVVMVPSEVWSGIQETLYLLSVPGLREELMKGKKRRAASCVKESTLKW